MNIYLFAASAYHTELLRVILEGKSLSTDPIICGSLKTSLPFDIIIQSSCVICSTSLSCHVDQPLCSRPGCLNQESLAFPPCFHHKPENDPDELDGDDVMT